MPETRPERIERKLRERLNADHVCVIDESDQHIGHAGAQGGAGHFRVEIVSAEFTGLNVVAAQRKVYDALADEMEAEIHALSMRTFTPEQWQKAQAAKTTA